CPRRDRRERAHRREPIAAELGRARAGRCREPLEDGELELEREAAIALAVAVRALEGALGVHEQDRARRQERPPARAAVHERPRHDERRRWERLALLERQVAWSRGA